MHRGQTLTIERIGIIRDFLLEFPHTAEEICERLRDRCSQQNRRATDADALHQGLSHIPAAREAQLAAEAKDRIYWRPLFFQWLETQGEPIRTAQGLIVGYGDHVTIDASGKYRLAGGSTARRAKFGIETENL